MVRYPRHLTKLYRAHNQERHLMDTLQPKLYTLGEDPPWREANTVHLSRQGNARLRVRWGPSVIRQDDENSVAIETINT